MMNIRNVIKAFVICVVINGIYAFYVSSSAFQIQGENLGLGENAGKLEAFIQASRVIEGFWPHVIKGWVYPFGLSFTSCLLLLLMITKKAYNKTTC